jgi:hypothetical protein
VPKCWVVPILPRSARLNLAERCLPQPKPRGFVCLRLPAGFARKSKEIGGTGLWSRDDQMLGGANFAAFCASQSGGALPPSAETPRIWAPPVTGRFWPEKSDNRGEPVNCVKEDGDGKTNTMATEVLEATLTRGSQGLGCYTLLWYTSTVVDDYINQDTTLAHFFPFRMRQHHAQGSCVFQSSSKR